MGASEVITSIHNVNIKRARSLLRRKGRAEERAFLVEGERAVAEMLSADVSPAILYVRNMPDDRQFLDQLDVRCPVRLVSSGVLASLSDVPHPQGVVAVVSIDSVRTAPHYDVWERDFILVVDGVRDPGNLGTLLRTAAGAGVTEVIVTPDSVDPYNPKCVRSAMGAHFLVSLRQMPWEALKTYLKEMPVIAVADPTGSESYDLVNWHDPCTIVVGSEAFGPNEAILGIATAYVRIPLARNLESLNAGVAGSHVVLEAARQRRLAATLQSQGFETSVGD